MTIYDAPKSDLNSGEPLIPKREKLGKVLSCVSLGSLLPIAGVSIAVYQVVGVFKEITADGAGDPSLISGSISQGLVTITVSVMLSSPSVVCIFFAVLFSTYRSKRFFRVWIIASIILLLSFPLGTVFGLVLGIMLILKRKEFSENS